MKGVKFTKYFGMIVLGVISLSMWIWLVSSFPTPPPTPVFVADLVFLLAGLGLVTFSWTGSWLEVDC